MWRAVVSQPFDRTCRIAPKGEVDEEAGEFWVENTFLMPQKGHNLSAYESNRVFLNTGQDRFIDVSFASAAAIDSDSRSVMATDFDGDHYPDLLVGSVGGGPLRLFRNQFPVRGHRVRVNLVGTDSNRLGIGARLTARLSDGQQVVREVFPANGFRGQGPAEVILGTGQSRTIQTLSVRWPTGRIQTFQDLPVDHIVTLTEGDDTPSLSPFGQDAGP